MRSLRIFSLIVWFVILLAFAGLAKGQDLDVFDDPDGKYTIKLPRGWTYIVNTDKLTGKSDAQIVYGVRENGMLKVRVIENVDPKLDVLDVAKSDENSTLRFVTGFTKGKVEPFAMGAPGLRNGALNSYDFVNTARQPQAGRNYYLRVNDTTVYVLRFTGRNTTLPSLRNQTDIIARSFRLKSAEPAAKASEAKPAETKPAAAAKP